MKTYKLVVYVPVANADQVRDAMSTAGAGVIGNYTDCSFSTIGKGRFKPGEEASPTIGSAGKLEMVEEERIEINCTETVIKKVIKSMKAVHPYEEVAYDVYERSEL